MPQILPVRNNKKVCPNRKLGVVITTNVTIWQGAPESVVDWKYWGDPYTFEEVGGGTFEDLP